MLQVVQPLSFWILNAFSRTYFSLGFEFGPVESQEIMWFLVACILACFSGTAALTYETLWNRILTNVLGASNFAATLVLVTFFAGLSLGAACLRRWDLVDRSPWLAFGCLEGGIALTVLPTFFLSFFDLYPGAGLSSPGWRTAVQVITAVCLIGPPTFLMGGTLLALVKATQGVKSQGRVSLLYGINTLGGVAGIAVSTFWLIYVVGIRANLLACMSLSVGICLVSLACHKRRQDGRQSALSKGSYQAQTIPAIEHAPPFWLLAIATASGITVISFEILLLHAFALVGQNSAWSFGAMLILVISALGIAALLTSISGFSRVTLLRWVLPLVSLGLALFTRNFLLCTKGLENISVVSESLGDYMLDLLWIGGLSGGPVLILAGIVFPTALDAATSLNEGKAHFRVGLLLACNALGAIAGAIGIQWWLVPALGIWKSCQALAIIPLITWFILEWKGSVFNRTSRWTNRVVVLSVMALVVLHLPQDFPYYRLSEDEKVVEVKTGPEGVVFVSKTRENLWRIGTNNQFSTFVGNKRCELVNQRMSHIPLLMHPNPERVAFIGMGTGQTASGAVKHHKVKSVTVLELSPLVVDLALKHFGPFTGRFENDPRLRILAADGVHYFATTSDDYEVVIGDVFFPWRQGVARLYSREHFTHVRNHLTPGGIFCQWLPLYQLDEESLSLIARTFQAIFPDGILVRNLRGIYEFGALLGHRNERPVTTKTTKVTWFQRQKEESLKDPFIKPPSFFDVMRIGRIEDIVPTTEALNTLDRPILEVIAIRLEPTLTQREFRINETFKFLRK